jgi:hypothetical protein
MLAWFYTGVKGSSRINIKNLNVLSDKMCPHVKLNCIIYKEYFILRIPHDYLSLSVLKEYFMT